MIPAIAQCPPSAIHCTYTQQSPSISMNVQQIVKQFPELLFLADHNVHITEEGIASQSISWSERAFGSKFIEFDRTLMSFFCLSCLLSDSAESYQKLTADQNSDKRLSFKSFQELNTKLSEFVYNHPVLSPSQVVQMLQVNLVLSDLGKSERARDYFKPFGVTAVDHDDFHHELMQVLEANPSLCPSFSQLPKHAQEILVQGANLAHYGHINHLEGRFNMFSQFKNSSVAQQQKLDCFYTDWWGFVCDVAGALGHVNQNSSIVLTEDCYKILDLTYTACSLLFDSQYDEHDCYYLCLSTRAQWLGLDINDPFDQALAKIGAMLRLTQPEDGEILKKLRNRFNKDETDLIVQIFGSETSLLTDKTPTYVPAVLVNAVNSLKNTQNSENCLLNALEKTLPVVAQILKNHSELIANSNLSKVNPLNFNAVAKFAKTSLDEMSVDSFDIQHDGIITLK